MDNDKYVYSIIAMITVGICLGIWQENFFAGLCGTTITFYTFMLRYD